MTATTTSGTVEHDDYPGRLLMEARAEIERLRRERDASNRLALRLQGEIERLRAPPTEAEVEAAATVMKRYYLGPYKNWHYLRVARAVLEAAAKVREGK